LQQLCHLGRAIGLASITKDLSELCVCAHNIAIFSKASEITTMALFKSKVIEKKADNRALDFLLRERISTQWAEFLLALGGELKEQLDADGLTELMQRVGQRFAQATQLEAGDTVEALQDSFNQVWAKSRWGHVALADEGDQLTIRHTFAPLDMGMDIGYEATAGFLQGAYQHWLEVAGASEGLEVQMLDQGAENHVIELRLAAV
jgi:hypothetical protein